MFCIKCGAKMLDGAKFCSKCGHSTNAADPPPRPSSEQTSVPPTQPNKADRGLRAFGSLCLAICAILAAISSFLGLGIPLFILQVLVIIGFGSVIISFILQLISRFLGK